MRVAPLLYVYSAAVLWSTIGVAAKLGFESGGSPLSTALARFFFVAIMASCFYIAGESARKVLLSPGVSLLGLAVVAPLGYAYMVSVKHSGVALAVVLLYTAPAWVAVFQSVLYRRAPAPLEALAVGLSVLGVLLLYHPSEWVSEATGLVSGLASGLLYALLIVFSKVLLDRLRTESEITRATAAIAVQGWAFPGLFLLAIVMEGNITITRADFVAGAYLGVFASGLAYYLFYKGLLQASPVAASIAATLEPMLAVAWGVVLLGEKLSSIEWIGIALILSSQALLTTKLSKGS